MTGQIKFRKRGGKKQPKQTSKKKEGPQYSKLADKASDSEDDTQLILGKYKSLEEVPREVGLTREEHDKLLARELKKNPWKYTVRQISTVELLLISAMVLLPSLVYGLIILNLPASKYHLSSYKSGYAA